jgi:hypothetical protein
MNSAVIPALVVQTRTVPSVSAVLAAPWLVGTMLVGTVLVGTVLVGAAAAAQDRLRRCGAG